MLALRIISFIIGAMLCTLAGHMSIGNNGLLIVLTFFAGFVGIHFGVSGRLPK